MPRKDRIFSANCSRRSGRGQRSVRPGLPSTLMAAAYRSSTRSQALFVTVEPIPGPDDGLIEFNCPDACACVVEPDPARRRLTGSASFDHHPLVKQAEQLIQRFSPLRGRSPESRAPSGPKSSPPRRAPYHDGLDFQTWQSRSALEAAIGATFGPHSERLLPNTAPVSICVVVFTSHCAPPQYPRRRSTRWLSGAPRSCASIWRATKAAMASGVDTDALWGLT